MKKLIFIILIAVSFMAYGIETGYTNGKIEKIYGSFIEFKSDNKTVVYKLAPMWYLDLNKWEFDVGDEIMIKYVDRNGVNHITEVVKDNKVYKFIDENGEFLWARKGVMRNHRGNGLGIHNNK